MPEKTYFKPNRTKVRHFSVCDAARVARYAVRDDGSPEEVLACIARGLGFTHISLSRPTSLEAAALPDVIKRLPEFLEKALVLLKILIKKYPWLPFLKDIIDTIQGILKIADKILELTGPEQKKVGDVIDKNKCDCKKENMKRTLLLEKPTR
jgi:hypothetical protein